MNKFRVEAISKTENPQATIWLAAHQDYSENFAFDEGPPATEKECGESVVHNLLKGGRGHYGPLEHPQIVLNCGWLPHSTMQQIRTHRVGVSFDVQSFRYTGQRISALGKEIDGHGVSPFSSVEEHLFCREYSADLLARLEKIFYLRPVGTYTDRSGKTYRYDEDHRYLHLIKAGTAALDYFYDMRQGLSEEHARGLIPFDVRQHWVMSANVRSLMHLLDLRWKADAQLECQQLCDLIWPHFETWVPEIAAWYEKNRAKKARLAP